MIWYVDPGEDTIALKIIFQIKKLSNEVSPSLVFRRLKVEFPVFLDVN